MADKSDGVFSLADSLPRLEKGRHRGGGEAGCAMEVASWLAGEKWSDHPHAVHPVIARVARSANDDIDDDEERSRLWSLILASLDTARPRRPLLWLRLHRAARTFIEREEGDMIAVWRDILAEHSRLTCEHEEELRDDLAFPSRS